MNEIVQVAGLSKQFTEVKAVDSLSFSVEKGEIYGFLGQNGAGKSTTIRMLVTLVRPTEGKISIFGKDIRTCRREILRQIGAIVETPELYQYLTAMQNLRIMARLSGIRVTQQQLTRQLERTGLAERSGSRVKTFSQGMKQRLGIACALIHEPRLIILDEPTNGLDPQGIADVRNLILHLSRDEGKTIFVSSHLLSEIELIADSMLIIDRGKKVAEGKVGDLLNPADTMVEVETTDQGKAMSILRQSQWKVRVVEEGLQASLQGQAIILKMHKEDVPDLVKYLVENSIGVVSVQARHSLENYFLSLTKANQHVATYRN
jgi:ABC-type multidrug transport system ATPase subunit